MVDRYPNNQPDPAEEGRVPSFANYDPSFESRWARLEKISRAHTLLGIARQLDGDLQGKLTKGFLSRSGGETKGGKYPFPHLRLKLKPKNRALTDVKVVALRFPSDVDNRNLHVGKLYVAYEDSSGEHTFYLSAEQYSNLDPKIAFASEGAGTVLPPLVEGLTAAQDIDLLVLETILGDNPDFELDLQPHQPDIGA